jgi:hypothetical protein
LPVEYHLLDVARNVLRVGKRRDAAFDIPRPHPDLASEKPPSHTTHTIDTWAIERRRRLEEWWPTFRRYARLVIANRNVHTHQESCLTGKHGITGCRFNSPWAHNLENSRIVELFCDVTDVAESERIEIRCPHCHAHGAMMDETILKEERDLKVAEEDNKRDMYYVAAKPTLRSAVGDDLRMLHFDLKRSKLPILENVKLALQEGDGPEAIEGLRRVLRSILETNVPLSRLLAEPDLRLLRDRLWKLTEVPTPPESSSKVIHIHISSHTHPVAIIHRRLRLWTTLDNSITSQFDMTYIG